MVYSVVHLQLHVVYAKVAFCHLRCSVCMLNDELIELLRDSGYSCYVNRRFIGCLMYADDLLLLSPTVDGMQALLDICDSYDHSSNFVLILKTACFIIDIGAFHESDKTLKTEGTEILIFIRYPVSRWSVAFDRILGYDIKCKSFNASVLSHFCTVFL